MKTRMRKLIVMLLASAVVFTMTLPASGAESMPDDTADIGEMGFSVQAYTGKGDAGNGKAPGAESYAEVSENWDVDSDPAAWSTATKYVKLEQGQEYYEGEPGKPEEPGEGEEDGGDGTDVYWFRMSDKCFNNWQIDPEAPSSQTVGEYIENNDKLFVEEGTEGLSYIKSDDKEAIESFHSMLDKLAAFYITHDYYIEELINSGPLDDALLGAGIQWVVCSPFSYFFESQDDNYSNPDDNYIRDGKVIQKDGVKNDGNYVYKAVAVDPDKKIYVLLRYWTLEDEETERRLGDHIIVSRFDAKSNRWVEDEINSRYNGNEMVLPYTGAKHIFDDGKGVKNAKKDKDIFVQAVLVNYNAATKKTSVINGLSVKNLKVKNNAAATVPGENWVYPTDKKNRAGAFGYSRIEKDGEDPTVTYSGFTSAPQLTAKEN